MMPAALLALLMASSPVGWQLAVDERFVASEHYLYGAHTPSLSVSPKGIPWIGFVRHGAKEFKDHQATLAYRTSKGWKFKEKLHTDASATLVRWTPAGLKVVIALLGNGSISIDPKGRRRSHALHARRISADGTLLGTYQSKFAKEGAAVLDLRDDNSVDNSCILDQGVVARFQDHSGWLGYFLFHWNGSRELLLKTDDAASCAALGSTVIFQGQIGGDMNPGAKILLWQGGATRALRSGQKPKPCTTTPEHCRGTFVSYRPLGLGRHNNQTIPIMVRYEHGARWAQRCSKHQVQALAGSGMPPCLEHSGPYHPGLDRKNLRSHALNIGDARFEVDRFSPNSEAAIATDRQGRVHIALYEAPKRSPVILRYFRLDPR